MTPFPATASTLSAKALGQFAIEKYGLDSESTCTLFRTGINHTYFITGNNFKYALRVYSFEWRTKPEIQEELRLLLLLKENYISVSYPIPDNKGEFIQEINAPEGIRYTVLFSFAQGDKVRFMDNNTCRAIGSLMAQLHKITVNQTINRIEYNAKTLLDLPYSYAKQFFSVQLPEMQFVKEISTKIAESFSKANVQHVKKGVVHLDIWYDNMSITDGNEITVFDFDFCGNGWQLLDVAYFCKQLFHIETDKDIYEQKRQSFIDGYVNVNKLSAAEIELIPHAGAAIYIFYLGVQSQRFDWSNIFLTENYLKMYVGRIKAWTDYHS